MAREFSVVVGINATKAQVGARQFKAASTTVNRANTTMQVSTARTTKRMTAMITTLGRFRGVATLAFAGLLGVGGISSVVKTLATFEASMKRVEALLGDRAVGGAMSALTLKARELGATTAFTASQAAEGMQFLTLAGFNALQTFQAIGPALDLAQAGALDLGSAADIVSNIMQGFNVKAEKTGEVVDALAFVAARSNTNIRQLGEAMKFVAPVAGAVGLKVQEVTAALGLLGNSGLQASLAGTSLRRVLSGLLNPSKEATKVLRDMGLSSEDLVKALQDPTKGLVYVIKQLENAGLDAAQAFTLFGQRGAPGVLSLVNQTDKLEKFNEQMIDIAGTAREIGRVMIDNLQGDARIAVSALQEAIIRLGEAGLLDWLRETTVAFTAFVRGIADIDQELEGATGKVQRWATAGQFMRENVDNLRRSLVVLVTFMNRAFLASLGKGVLALGAWALNAARVVFGIRNMIQATAVLVLSMQGLRAAILATGIGAFAIAIGFLLDWVLFSGDAEYQNNRVSESFSRMRSEVENLAFKFAILTEEEKKNAIVKLSSAILEEEARLIRLTRQVENSTDATKRITEAEVELATARELANQTSERTFNTKEGEVALLFQNEEGLKRVAAAERDLAAAELLLSTAQGATNAEVLEQTRLIADLNLRLEAQQAVVDGVAESVKDYLLGLNNIAKANDLLGEGLIKTIGLTAKETLQLAELIKKYTKTEQKIEDTIDNLEILSKAMLAQIEVEKKLGKETGTLVKVQEALEFELRKLRLTLSPAAKALETVRDKVAKLAAGTDKAKLATAAHIIKMRELAREMIVAKLPIEEQAAALRDLAEAHRENLEEIAKVCPENKKMRECTEDTAKRMEAIWDQAMRNIQDSFADAFRGAFDSFEDFADNLLDAFKDLIAQMAAQAAIANLFGEGGGFFSDFAGGLTGGGGGGGFGGVLGNVVRGGGSTGGGGGGGGTTGGTGILGSLGGSGSTLSNAYNTFAAGAATFFQGAGAFLGIGESMINGLMLVQSGSGAFGVGASSTAIAAESGTLAGAGAVTAGAGIGAIVGTVADAILGGRGDPMRNAIFSAIGGAIGSIWGPIGSAIGGAIGSLVDNIIGGAQKLEKATLSIQVAADQWFATQTTIISTQKSWFGGKDYEETTRRMTRTIQGLEDLFIGFAGVLERGAEGLGGGAEGFLDDFEASIDINVKGKGKKKSARIQEILTQFLENTMLGAIDSFLENVEGLDEHVHRTLESFSNSIENFVSALVLLTTIQNLFDIDLVEGAAGAIEESQMGIFQAYERALAGYRNLIAEYDGSIGALDTLTTATAVMIQVQLDLVAVYQQTGVAISQLLQTSAQTVREALLSEEELFTLRKSQIDELVAQIATTTDPVELSRLAEEINRLGLDAFNMLDQAQQVSLGPEFISFFEELDALFGEQVQTGIADVRADQAALDQEVATAMTEAATAIIEAQVAARDLYEEWRIRLREDRYRDRGGPDEITP